MPYAKNTISVLSGQKKEKVGVVPLAVGMLTNRGVVTRITEGGVVFTRAKGEEKDRRTQDADKLSVRLTEARKFGYPEAKGCRRFKEVLLRRGEKTVSA